ncbi:hopanoid biosynthesis associated radical SAM protein HpnJ [Candidatus Nitrosacidococcus tergens]|uniref:Fe-S protein, radical SAM family n=1 Tax=Candidatus Nitrosacidococcus tergens TaxID=553981 RepID=A0A7G1Q9Y1_9GAMM|nr:hopanoid biosynthesis associated radical SAM protein HpnJ [Candidatus Nitrosacidococcus tergens]CAB1275631.1 Fe-S protein, radical SAM family [Candidatus Nitrosacidococcus tergens]
MMKTLFLNPPSFEGFDGGAGSRYQARREIRSFWYPTWLAQPAALIPESKLIDAPARELSLQDILPLVNDYELVILHTSTPSFNNDVKVAESLKEANPKLKIGLVGAHVAVNPEPSVLASSAIDFIARNEFDYTIQEVAQGHPLETINGLSYKVDGKAIHNPERALIANMDDLPSVIDVYKRDLVIEDYFIGYLEHPYVSFYTGRGCKSHCTFCLWPQTIGGHKYRTRSPEVVAEEVAKIQRYFPQVKEVFFDDDTFTDDKTRTEETARLLGKLGVTWSCNAKANVPYETLKIMKDNGLRLLLVGYETGSQQILLNIKKGMKVEFARRFTADCHKLGIKIHGTFIVGLPGETRETIQETIRFAQEINPHTIQVSLAAAYPGTFLYRQAKENGWLRENNQGLVADNGLQISSLEYPHLSHEEIFNGLSEFYKRFYFRPKKIGEITWEMLHSWEMTKRRMREAAEFFRFLGQREDSA